METGFAFILDPTVLATGVLVVAILVIAFLLAKRR
jgi:hypothetical protein